MNQSWKCWKVKFAKEWRRSLDICWTERGKEGERILIIFYLSQPTTISRYFNRRKSGSLDQSEASVGLGEEPMMLIRKIYCNVSQSTKKNCQFSKVNKKWLKLISWEPLLDWDGRRGNTVDRWDRERGGAASEGPFSPFSAHNIIFFCP